MIRYTARLDRGGNLAVCWTDGTGRHRSVEVAISSPALTERRTRRRWAFEELRRAGWSATGPSWRTDELGADTRTVIRRNPL